MATPGGDSELKEPGVSPSHEVLEADKNENSGGPSTEPHVAPASNLMSQERSCVFEERLSTAAQLRGKGNELFQAGSIKEAAEAYTRALHHLDFDEMQVEFELGDKHRALLVESKLPVLLNLCQCLMKTSRSDGAADNASQAAAHAGEAIKLDPSSAKAHFWRGKARMDMGDLDDSAEDLEEALRLAPTDKAVRVAHKSLRMKQKEHAQRSRNIWGGMFAGRGGGGVPRGVQGTEQGSGAVKHPAGGWGSTVWVVSVAVALVAAGAAGVLMGSKQ